LLPSTIVSGQQSLINAQTSLTNLLESRVPTGQAQQSVAQDQQNLNNAQDQRAGLNGATNASQDTINQAQANYDLAKIKAKTLQDRYNHTRGKPENSLVKATALSKLDQAIQQRDTALRNLNWDKAHPSNIDIAKATASVAVAQDQLANDQYQFNQLKNGPTSNDIAAAEAAVASAQAVVDQAQLTTPISGTVTQVDVKPNDLVAPGTVAFQVDDMSSMYVDLQVSEVDIIGVKIGQPVNLTFDAIPNKQYTGKVTQIGLAGVSNQGVVDFPVTVQLDASDNLVKPGMTAAANIVVNQVSDALLVPDQAIQTINNQPVVFVLRNGQFQSIKIQLGATSGTMSQVLSGGLKAGDVVVLNPPASLLNSNGRFSGPVFGGGGGQGG
jgi:HlyD family secretion protein